MSEELGRTIDRVSALVDLALTLAATGETGQALEIAATAFAHPLSDQITIWDGTPVRSRALALRSSLEEAITPEESESAWARGLAADFDHLVTNLIEASPSRVH